MWLVQTYITHFFFLSFVLSFAIFFLGLHQFTIIIYDVVFRNRRKKNRKKTVINLVEWIEHEWNRFSFWGYMFLASSSCMCAMCYAWVGAWASVWGKAIELQWPKPNRNRYFLWLESHFHSRKNKLSWIDHIRFDGAPIWFVSCVGWFACVWRKWFAFFSFLCGFRCVYAFVCLEHT